MNLRYLKISKSPDTELLDILNHNIIGSPGSGMLYQHMGVREKLDLIDDPYFVNLHHASRIVGTCCFCNRITHNRKEPVRSFYIRYFSFRDMLRRKSIPARERKKSSVLKPEIDALLSGEGLDVNHGDKFFHYAYVDAGNPRSALLCKEFGFEPVRQYTTLVFSRLFPQKNEILKIEEAPLEEAQKLLNTFYQNFNMLSFENFKGRKYFFVKDDKGQKVAGALVNPDQWRIHALPGFVGKILLSRFSSIPILNRIVSKKFRFITLEGIYYMPGHEIYLEKLFESLLAQYKVYSAICVVDAEGSLYSKLKSLRFGWVSKLRKEVRGDVIARFANFSEEEKNTFRKTEVYISGIDAT